MFRYLIQSFHCEQALIFTPRTTNFRFTKVIEYLPTEKVLEKGVFSGPQESYKAPLFITVKNIISEA